MDSRDRGRTLGHRKTILGSEINEEKATHQFRVNIVNDLHCTDWQFHCYRANISLYGLRSQEIRANNAMGPVMPR